MTDERERKEKVLEFTEELRAAGIARVSVGYSGYGDEGRTENRELHGVDGSPIGEADLAEKINLERLGDLLGDFAPQGYEDGEGGFGTVVFIVETGKIRVEHNWYETISHEGEPQEF